MYIHCRIPRMGSVGGMVQEAKGKMCGPCSNPSRCRRVIIFLIQTREITLLPFCPFHQISDLLPHFSFLRAELAGQQRGVGEEQQRFSVRCWRRVHGTEVLRVAFKLRYSFPIPFFHRQRGGSERLSGERRSAAGSGFRIQRR